MLPSTDFPETTTGLSEAEAGQRLLLVGPNMVPLPLQPPWRRLVLKFWSPVPWMLEVASALEFATGKFLEGVIVILLLVMNGLLAFFSEEKGEAALQNLKKKMDVFTRAFRDGAWKVIPSRNIVPGDLVHIRMGDFVPADLFLKLGAPLIDQSSLTGESFPVSKQPGDTLFAGTVVRRGEGTGIVTRTGADCAYGRTVQLIHDASTRSHAEETVLKIVRSLLMVDLLLALVIIPLGLRTGLSFSSLITFLLILLISAIPVALPPMFTLANALSAATLGNRHVLVTKLSSISDAAEMEELICDKTGTLTENRLEVKAITPIPGHTENEVLEAAILASDPSTQDPLDTAILKEGARRGLSPDSQFQRIEFIPFDPEKKRTEVLLLRAGVRTKVVKGSPLLLKEQRLLRDSLPSINVKGQRPIAVLSGGEDGPLNLLGLVWFDDPLRTDSQSTLSHMRELGIRIRLATGDTPEAAVSLSRELGFLSPPCASTDLDKVPDSCDLFAGIFPEDKFQLVRQLQARNRTVGMTGDGVNDAPALRQAEVGIAVAQATDIARASAGLVLLLPGLSGLIEVVKEGRKVIRRLQSYILNKIVKTLEISLFLTGGLLLLHTAVIGPRQILLLIFTNDFVTMSLANDTVRISQKPDSIDVSKTVRMGFLYAVCWLFLTFSIFAAGRIWLHLSSDGCETLSFLTLVLTGIGNVFVIRDPGPLWRSSPSPSLLVILIMDVLMAGVLSGSSFLFTPIPVPVILGVIAIVAGATLAIDALKRFWNYPLYSGVGTSETA